MVTHYVKQMNQTDKFMQVFMRRGPRKKSCTLHIHIIKYEMSLTLQNKSSNTVYDSSNDISRTILGLFQII